VLVLDSPLAFLPGGRSTLAFPDRSKAQAHLASFRRARPSIAVTGE
jgi:hypothetical protein